MERFQIREKKKKHRKELKRQKKEQKEMEKKIFELRLKDTEFKSRKTEKKDVMTMYWHGKLNGDYIGPGFPSIVLDKYSTGIIGNTLMCLWSMTFQVNNLYYTRD